jgi:hypothetical protein
MEMVCMLCVARHPLTCVVPSGSRLINFLKTHAITASAHQPWSPRAFQKISDSTAQWFPLGRMLAHGKQLRLDGKLRYKLAYGLQCFTILL